MTNKMRFSRISLKKILLIVLLLILWLNYCSNGASKYDPKHCAANVQLYNGIHVFILSEPVYNYELLGPIDIKFSTKGDARTLLNLFIKKQQQYYPTADGIIIDEIGFDHARCVKFLNN